MKMFQSNIISTVQIIIILIFVNVVFSVILSNSLDRAYQCTKLWLFFSRGFTREKVAILYLLLQLAILWNKGGKEVAYDWLAGGWCASHVTGAGDVSRLERTLDALIGGKGRLQYTAEFPPFYDEHALVSENGSLYGMLLQLVQF